VTVTGAVKLFTLSLLRRCLLPVPAYMASTMNDGASAAPAEPAAGAAAGAAAAAAAPAPKLSRSKSAASKSAVAAASAVSVSPGLSDPMQIGDGEDTAEDVRAKKTAAATADAKSYMAEQLATLKGRHADMHSSSQVLVLKDDELWDVIASNWGRNSVSMTLTNGITMVNKLSLINLLITHNMNYHLIKIF
jgi:hypothetical protein